MNVPINVGYSTDTISLKPSSSRQTTFRTTLFATSPQVLLRYVLLQEVLVSHTHAAAQGTVATTVCSPADVLKSRIMNASGPGSSVRLRSPPYFYTRLPSV